MEHISYTPEYASPSALPRRAALQSLCTASLSLLFTGSSHAEDKKKKPPALNFDGEKGHVVVPRLRYRGEHPLTICVRCTPKTISGQQTLLGDMHRGGFGVQLHDGFIELLCNNGQTYITAKSDTSITPGEPVTVVGICDGRFLRLYVNEELQQDTPEWKGRFRPSGLPLFIGADPDAQARPQNLFTGSIEALRISAVARDTLRTRKKWFEDPFAKTDQFDVLHFKFDPEDDMRIEDQSPGKRHGILSNVEWEK